MSVSYSFQRYEFKYLMDKAQYEHMRRGLEGRMAEDEYGLTTICSVYYDTEDYRLIRDSLEKPVYKEKLRLRSYGVPKEESTVYLEIKKKFDGVVYKRRIPLTLKDAELYLSDGVRPHIQPEHKQIFGEIDYFMSFYSPEKKLFLAYDRIAMKGTEDPALRVTFDKNIRSRTDELTLLAGDMGRPILPEDTYLMETKTAGAMPIWLVKLIDEAELNKTSFSKYGTVYKNELIYTRFDLDMEDAVYA